MTTSHLRAPGVLDKRKPGRTFVGFKPVLDDPKKDFRSGGKFCFERYQEFGD